MIVTTTAQPSERIARQASHLSRELSATLKPRGNLTVRKLMAMSEDGRLIVVTEQEVRYYEGQTDSPFYFHPSMAFVRVKRLRRGDTDPLIELSGCEAGDRVIDCTAGLAADSLVFSYAAGPQGSVTAIESEPVLCAIVRLGLAGYETGLPDVNAAMRRIELRCMNHGDYLSSLPDKSADIVYFDPMFRQPIRESSAMEPLRAMANMDALSEEVVEHAKRVARKSVVLKEHQASGEFARLGFERKHVNSSKIAYGVIEL
ncbi:class I SAM-dependent methyltransferase [Paenibacillus arenilitoris]|uniref:Class I SAM-dependent methyltransferase n=1 Tax=Paenibacillus arenilitoris TaxID=2772299 RepID=A0A927CLP5_9BACL|nr:class I SAM-dependent methyltransferase [Paenibacillus arenilitoris]MBD2869844.1 class I SAM-dependent methyltransferase [Paenibacillus arenilitoris]